MITIRTRLTVNGNANYLDTVFETTSDDPRNIFRNTWIDPMDQWNFETVVNSLNEQLTLRGFEFQLEIAESYPLGDPFPLEKLPVDINKQRAAVISGLDKDGLYSLTFHYGTEQFDTGNHTLISLFNEIWNLRARTADEENPQVRDGIKFGNRVLPIYIGVMIHEVGTDDKWFFDSSNFNSLDSLNNFLFEDGVEYSTGLTIDTVSPNDLRRLHPEDGYIHVDGRVPFNITLKAVDPSSIAGATIKRHSLMGDEFDDAFTPESTYTTDFDGRYLYVLNMPDMRLNPRLTLLNVSGTSDIVEIIRSLPGEYPPPDGFPRILSDPNIDGDLYYLNDLLPYSIKCDLGTGTVTSSDLIVDFTGAI